jgi:fucose permease
MPDRFTRNRFTWLAYLLLAFYSYYINIIGPVTPFLKDEMRLSYTVGSLHYSAFAAGILAVGLVGHLVIRRVGRWRALWIGAAGMSLGALALIAGQSPLVTVAAAFLMGCIGSLILAVVPVALSDQHGEQRAVAISEANVIASIVAAAAPLLVGWFANAMGSWRLALLSMALAPLAIRLGVGRADPVVHPSAASSPVSAGAAKRLPALYWFYWVGIVLVVSVEFCMISWSADYLERELGMVKANAAQAVSLFLGAMIVGRLAVSRLVQHFSSRSLVTLSILLAIAGFLVYWTTTSAVVGMVGLFLTGLGVASLYPLILSMAIAAANGNTVQAGARATLASGTAILVLPLVLGRVADAAGIRPAYGVVAVLLVSALPLIQVAGRLFPARQAMSLERSRE